VVDALGAATVTGGSVTIDHVNNKIVIDPTFDLDLSNNYTLSAATGAFTGVGSHLTSQAFTTVNFSTVTPGSSTSFYVADPAGDGSLPPAVNSAAAATSVIMNTTTGGKDTSLSWVDVTNATAMGQDVSQGLYGVVDASAANYAFVTKNINTSSSTMKITDTYVKFTNFGASDLLYIDNQFNDGLANWLATGAFSGGKGTAVDPFSVTVGGSSLGSSFQFVVDSAVTLPSQYTAGPYVNSLLASVNANHWSDTGVVIAA
jgi:large repetitive protein